MPFTIDVSNYEKPIDVLSAFPQHDHTLHGFFASRLGGDPQADRPFLLAPDRTLSYRQFADRVDAVAALLTCRNIGRGDRFAVMAGNGDGHVVMLFALSRLGAILVPVNPGFNVAEARFVLHHAEVCGVACDAAALPVAIEACRGMAQAPWFVMLDTRHSEIPGFDELLAQTPVQRDTPVEVGRADDTCAIVYTSGTTGFPKGVMHSQRTFCLSGERHLERSWLQRDGRMLCVLPMFHVNALFYSISGTIAAGVDMVIAPRFSASRFWQLAADSGATQTSLLMAAATILTRRPRSEYVASHRLQVVVGSPVTHEITRGVGVLASRAIL